MLKRALPYGATLLMLFVTALAQTPATNTKHYEKDGLSFDYPATWQISDSNSSLQIQIVQLARGDGYAELRVRAPRQWVKTPEEQAHARKIVQDKYVDDFIDSMQQGGLRPTRANLSSEIAGGPAEGTKVRANLGGEVGGMDSIYRVVSDRFINLSRIGGERDFTNSADAWDMIRTTLKVAALPEPKPSPTPTPKKP